ncbi:MAG: MmgE/PrpD family protein [Alphaproteobacteria bacterium]|nr:MmgE/PrpD family protein [Alphaproteobacteria bacterium]
MQLIHAIADYAIAERTRALPAEVFHAAKRAVIDWCAATAPGAVVMPATGFAAAMAEELDHGKARLFPSGRAATTRAAAFINGAASHTVEFDDIFRDAIYHPGTPTVAAAMAVADTLGASGEAFLRAVIIGYEVSTRIGVVMGRPHYRFWHNTATIGTFGAAAAAGTLLGLSREQFAHALTTAATMAAGLQQAFRSDSMSKPVHGGHGADAGCLAAMGAKHGVTGALDILEGEVGFGVAMSQDADWSKATEGLGSRYNITRMTVKNHACCGHTFAAIDGALALKAEHGIDPDKVAKIHVGGYSATVNVCGNHKHATVFEGKFSLPYVVATALVHGSVRLDAFGPARLACPRTAALLRKVSFEIDPDVDGRFPNQRAAKVAITMQDGRTLSVFQPTRKGDPDAPLSDAELEGKFRELVAPVTGPQTAEAMLAALWRAEALPSLRELPMGRDGAPAARAAE